MRWANFASGLRRSIVVSKRAWEKSSVAIRILCKTPRH